MITVALVLLVAVLVGAILQRITGMGLGLVAGPVLSVALGPAAGVTVVNGLSVVNAANNAWAVRARTDWHRFRFLIGGMVVGSVPAAFVVTAIDGPWLLVTVGLLVMAALGVSMLNTAKLRVSDESRTAMIVTGVAGGFMSTLVGIAAPAFTIYARITRWDYRDFVATLHPVILVANAISFVVKIIVLTHIDTGDLPVWIWAVALVTIFVGAWFGDRLNDRMSSEGMRRLATLLAFAGAATLLIQGIVQLVS